MLVDTDVLIWYMRGNGKALRAIEALVEFFHIRGHLHQIGAGTSQQGGTEHYKKLPAISIRSCSACHRKHIHCLVPGGAASSSHSLGFSDAIIAATAMSHGLPLMTANTKHYQS